MNEVIIYLLKVIAIHGLLYLFYRLVFRNSARHSFNRAYLLGSLLLAFIIPFIEIPSFTSAVIEEEKHPLFVLLSEPAYGFTEFEFIPVNEEVKTFSYWSLLPWLYGLIAVILLVRSVVYLFMLNRLKRHSEYVKKHWFKLFKTSHARPFSFFSNVFIPKPLFGSDAFKQILAHECVHVRQFHSVDRLLLDFVVSLFWFNPFIYLYRSALIEIHEYQADEAVVNQFKDPVAYQEVLFSQLQSAQYSGLVSHFNFSMIKRRIVMMNKQNRMSGWVYALTVPMTLMIVFAFSSKEAMEPINEVGDEISSLIGPIDDWKDVSFDFYQETQKSKEPSISPIKEEDLTRMSSGYGMRTHPIYKVKKMHKGMDFACEMGTKIYATGDGTVLKVEEKFKGYGKLLTIDHGNGFVTRYAQLSDFKVKEGDEVKKGDLVALSGNSGMSTAPHLHYEVIKNGEHVDPIDYIKDYEVRKKRASASSKAYDEEVKRKKSELRAQQEVLATKQSELQQITHLREKEERMQAELEAVRAHEEHNQLEQMELQKMEELKQEEKRLMEEMRYVNELETRRTFEELSQRHNVLYILDGEELTQKELYDMDLLPKNIETVTVLKKRSDRVKYNALDKDGVIVITTKDKDKQKSKLKPKGKTKQKDKKKEKSKPKKTAYRVIIDPGHGGKDAGAESPSGALEKEIALAIAQKVKAEFGSDAAIEIVLTRDNDSFLGIRERYIKSEDADLFISLHTDNYSGKGSFIVPVYNDQNEFSEESKRLAQLLATEFESEGKDARVGYSSGYAVLENANCPAVLLNVGWFSDKDEDQYLSTDNGQYEVAQQISDAIKLAVL